METEERKSAQKISLVYALFMCMWYPNTVAAVNRALHGKLTNCSKPPRFNIFKLVFGAGHSLQRLKLIFYQLASQ